MKLINMLICPADRASLIMDDQSGSCPKCGMAYKKIEGIWKLYPTSDYFNDEPKVMNWFDERAETIEDEQVLRGTPSRWYEEFFERDFREIQKSLNLRQSDYFLDIGCGNGLFLQRFASLVSEAVGIDISFGMLKRAQEHLISKDVLLMQTNALQLPFSADTFDAILCNWVLHYFKRDKILKFFSELKRVAKKDAQIFLGEIPLKRSFRDYESRVGHFLVRKFKVKVSDRYLSSVETTKFTPVEIKDWAGKVGLRVVSQGTMRHILPSLRIPYLGQLVPYRIQHLLGAFDYKKSIPLVRATYFFVLKS